MVLSNHGRLIEETNGEEATSDQSQTSSCARRTPTAKENPNSDQTWNEGQNPKDQRDKLKGDPSKEQTIKNFCKQSWDFLEILKTKSGKFVFWEYFSRITCDTGQPACVYTPV